MFMDVSSGRLESHNSSDREGSDNSAAGEMRVPGTAWFCLRTQPKHEHIAAAHLKKEPEIEVYLPRIRFKRASRKGPILFTEALFPGYLFARFEAVTCARKVEYAQGVREIVRFGDHWPTIPAELIEDLRRTVSGEQVHVIPEDFEPGETVVVAGGAFHNFRGVVTRVMRGRDRVAVLFDLLGRLSAVEVPRHSLVREGGERERILLQ
jgi:transcriptional antiterminator RfaH